MRDLTITVICVAIGGVLLYDALALMSWGRDATISVVINDLSGRYPIIPLLVGIVLGHLFWPLRKK